MSFLVSDWEFSSYEDKTFVDAVANLNASSDGPLFPVDEFKYDENGLYYVSKD